MIKTHLRIDDKRFFSIHANFFVKLNTAAWLRSKIDPSQIALMRLFRLQIPSKVERAIALDQSSIHII